MSRDAVAFRPPARRIGVQLLVGAAAGAVVCGVAGIPAGLGLLFGAAAAGIAVSTRHAGGLRLVADARGVRALGGGSGLDGPWEELRLGLALAQREDGDLQRYALLADARGRSFAFADVTARGIALPPVRGADGAPVTVVELREAPLLLALLVQRLPAWELLPVPLRAPPAPLDTFPPPGRVLTAAPAPAPQEGSLDPGAPLEASGAPAALAEEGASPSAGPPPQVAPAALPAAPRRTGLGIFGALAKLGSKLLASLGKMGGAALKAAKAANVGWAAASVAAWSLVFTWQFALALMVQLFVHEYGHVHAMRRAGMRVRGIYFVPLLGAAAVAEDAYPSRADQVRVALAGPLWGSLFALAPAAVWWWTRQPIWAAVATWWVLLNLFNLLPIAPLDGGKVLQAFGSSFSSGVGLALTALGLAAAAALATAVGFSLLWFVVVLGAMELLGEAQSRQGLGALRLLPDPGRFGAAHWLWLRAALGTGGRRASDGFFLARLARQERAARAAPLSVRGMVLWGLAYAVLAVALVAFLHGMRGVPGAASALGVLQ